MHRNTLIVIILLAVFAVIIVSVNLRKQPETADTHGGNTAPTPTIKLLSDQTCGIQYSYPESITKINIQTGGATLINPNKANDAVVIVCQEDIPRVPLAPEKIESFPIGSVSASLYHDAEQKDGTPIDKLIFTHPTLRKTDVYVAGYGELFNQIIRTIQIIPNK